MHQCSKTAFCDSVFRCGPYCPHCRPDTGGGSFLLFILNSVRENKTLILSLRSQCACRSLSDIYPSRPPDHRLVQLRVALVPAHHRWKTANVSSVFRYGPYHCCPDAGGGANCRSLLAFILHSVCGNKTLIFRSALSANFFTLPGYDPLRVSRRAFRPPYHRLVQVRIVLLLFQECWTPSVGPALRCALCSPVLPLGHRYWDNAFVDPVPYPHVLPARQCWATSVDYLLRCAVFCPNLGTNHQPYI